MMKILFFIESLHSGGKERRLVELIKGLMQYPNIQMELVLTKKDIHYTDILDTGIKIHYLIRKRLKKDPSIFWKFYEIAKDYKPDIIHVWGNIVAIYAIPAKLILNIPMINNQISYALHIRKYSKFSLLSKFSFLFSDIVVANSKAGLLAHNLKEDKKNKIIYNGFNFERLKTEPIDLKKELNIRNGSNLLFVGMVASFNEAKDYKTLIKVAYLFMNKYRNVHFILVGEGKNKKTCQNFVRQNKINNIHFLGNRTDVERICMSIDIGVLLSNTNGHAEGISNSIMEYMAAGKPVIATKAGGTIELVEDSKTGFLIPPFSVEALKSTLETLINDNNKRKLMGLAGMERIKNYFNIDIMIKKYKNLFSLLSK